MVRRLSLFPRHGRGIIDDLTEELNGEDSQAIGVTAGRNTPVLTGVFLEEFDEDKPDGVWPFRELVGSSMWHTNQTRPDISNAARTVARFAHAPKQKHWKAARGISESWKASSSTDATFPRGSGLELVVYADAAYAPKETTSRCLYQVEPRRVGMRPLH